MMNEEELKDERPGEQQLTPAGYFWRRGNRKKGNGDVDSEDLDESELEDSEGDAFAEALQGWAEKKASTGFWQRRFFVLAADLLGKDGVSLQYYNEDAALETDTLTKAPKTQGVPAPNNPPVVSSPPSVAGSIDLSTCQKVERRGREVLLQMIVAPATTEQPPTPGNSTTSDHASDVVSPSEASAKPIQVVGLGTSTTANDTTTTTAMTNKASEGLGRFGGRRPSLGSGSGSRGSLFGTISKSFPGAASVTSTGRSRSRSSSSDGDKNGSLPNSSAKNFSGDFNKAGNGNEDDRYSSGRRSRSMGSTVNNIESSGNDNAANTAAAAAATTKPYQLRFESEALASQWRRALEGAVVARRVAAAAVVARKNRMNASVAAQATASSAMGFARYDMVFSEQRVGFSLRAARRKGELPVVGVSVAATKGDTTIRATPGHFIESIGERSLRGEDNPWDLAVRLIRSSPRPLTIRFINPMGSSTPRRNSLPSLVSPALSPSPPKSLAPALLGQSAPPAARSPNSVAAEVLPVPAETVLVTTTTTDSDLAVVPKVATTNSTKAGGGGGGGCGGAVRGRARSLTQRHGDVTSLNSYKDSGAAGTERKKIADDEDGDHADDGDKNEAAAAAAANANFSKPMLSYGDADCASSTLNGRSILEPEFQTNDAPTADPFVLTNNRTRREPPQPPLASSPPAFRESLSYTSFTAQAAVSLTDRDDDVAAVEYSREDGCDDGSDDGKRAIEKRDDVAEVADVSSVTKIATIEIVKPSSIDATASWRNTSEENDDRRTDTHSDEDGDADNVVKAVVHDVDDGIGIGNISATTSKKYFTVSFKVTFSELSIDSFHSGGGNNGDDETLKSSSSSSSSSRFGNGEKGGRRYRSGRGGTMSSDNFGVFKCVSAACLGVPESQVGITSVSAGSVVVDAKVSGLPDAEAAEDVARKVCPPSSSSQDDSLQITRKELTPKERLKLESRRRKLLGDKSKPENAVLAREILLELASSRRRSKSPSPEKYNNNNLASRLEAKGLGRCAVSAPVVLPRPPETFLLSTQKERTKEHDDDDDDDDGYRAFLEAAEALEEMSETATTMLEGENSSSSSSSINNESAALKEEDDTRAADGDGFGGGDKGEDPGSQNPFAEHFRRMSDEKAQEEVEVRGDEAFVDEGCIEKNEAGVVLRAAQEDGDDEDESGGGDEDTCKLKERRIPKARKKRNGNRDEGGSGSFDRGPVGGHSSEEAENDVDSQTSSQLFDGKRQNFTELELSEAKDDSAQIESGVDKNSERSKDADEDTNNEVSDGGDDLLVGMYMRMAEDVTAMMIGGDTAVDYSDAQVTESRLSSPSHSSSSSSSLRSPGKLLQQTAFGDHSTPTTEALKSPLPPTARAPTYQTARQRQQQLSREYSLSSSSLDDVGGGSGQGSNQDHRASDGSGQDRPVRQKYVPASQAPRRSLTSPSVLEDSLARSSYGTRIDGYAREAANTNTSSGSSSKHVQDSQSRLSRNDRSGGISKTALLKRDQQMREESARVLTEERRKFERRFNIGGISAAPIKEERGGRSRIARRSNSSSGAGSSGRAADGGGVGSGESGGGESGSSTSNGGSRLVASKRRHSSNEVLGKAGDDGSGGGGGGDGWSMMEVGKILVDNDDLYENELDIDEAFDADFEDFVDVLEQLRIDHKDDDSDSDDKSADESADDSADNQEGEENQSDDEFEDEYDNFRLAASLGFISEFEVMEFLATRPVLPSSSSSSSSSPPPPPPPPPRVPPPRHLRTPNNDRDHDSDNDSVEETQIPLTPAQMRVAASERMREHRAWLTNLKAREGSNPLPATNQKKPPAAVASKAAGDDELAAKEASVKSPRGVAGEVLSEARRDYDARRRRHSANMLTTPKQFDLSTTNSATTSASATPRRTPPARSMRRYKSAPITFADNATGATARGTVRNSSAAAPVDGSGTATPGRAADDDSDSTATVPASAASQQTLQEKVPKKDGSIQRVLFSDDLTNATPRRPPPTLSSTMPSTLPFDSKERAVPRPRNGNGGSNSKKNSKKNNKINSNNNSSINSNKNNKNSNNNLSSSEGLSAAAGIRRERRPLQPSSSLPPPPPPPSSLPPSSPLLLRSPSSPCPLGGQTDSSAASRRGRLDRGEEGVRPKPSLGNNASSGKAFRSRSLTGVESKRSDEQDESDEHDDDDDVDVDDDVEYFDVGKCDPPPPPLPLPSPHPLHRASSALGKLITSPISGVLRKRPTEKKTPNKRTTVSQDNVQNNVQDNVQDNAQDSNNAGRRSWSEANKTKGSREVAVKEEVEGDVKESTELLQEWGARQPAPQQQQQQQQQQPAVNTPPPPSRRRTIQF